MKITKHNLQDAFSQAARNISELSNQGLTEQEFLAKCWMDACALILNQPGLEYPQLPKVEVVEE